MYATMNNYYKYTCRLSYNKTRYFGKKHITLAHCKRKLSQNDSQGLQADNSNQSEEMTRKLLDL